MQPLVHFAVDSFEYLQDHVGLPRIILLLVFLCALLWQLAFIVNLVTSQIAIQPHFQFLVPVETHHFWIHEKRSVILIESFESNQAFPQNLQPLSRGNILNRS